MSITVVVAVLIAFLAALGAYKGLVFFLKAGSSYQEKFTSQAQVRLADLFLFIEPSKIFVFNIILIIIAFLLTYIMTGLLIPAVLVAVLAGFFPTLLYKFLRKRRHKIFIMQLPDMLQASATAMKAGSSLNQAIESVVNEESGPISQEFDLFLRELRVGVDFNQALNNIYDRVPLQDLKLVVSGMQISRDIGGNLADTLERLADTLRRKIEMEGKIDALTAQGRAQGYVMTGLPILLGFVLFQMEPEHMSKLWTQWYGWIVIALVIIMEAIGYFFIRKIVNIDV
ncbi:MAG: type II secretion system F family protein [Gammaproteobacteria bacterium]|nr:type II secretion system F family protein [Gammaproteobacteria bacterium]NVK86600.1 type II secretion system F family protein [Gammaproteobacteria bacterium]